MIKVKGFDAYTLHEREHVHVSKLWCLNVQPRSMVGREVYIQIEVERVFV